MKLNVCATAVRAGSGGMPRRQENGDLMQRFRQGSEVPVVARARRLVRGRA